MENAGDPNSFRLNRYPERHLTGTGLKGNRGIFLQQYWARRKPYYAIANVTADIVTLNVAGWNNGNIGDVLASWKVGPASIECFQIADLMHAHAGELLAFLCNDERSTLGLLKAPRLPEVENWSEAILTVEGLNGLGDRDSGIRCWQPYLVLKPGGVVKFLLQVPAGIATILFNTDRGENELSRSAIIHSASATLAIEQLEKGFRIVNETATQKGPHEIFLTVKIPDTTGRKMSSFAGRVTARSGGSFIFSRGLIVSDTG